MIDLILRPSGLAETADRAWSLQLRQHSLAETEYHTLTAVSDITAREIVSAGKPFWLYGEPDWDKRAKARQRAEAEALRRLADDLEKAAAAGKPEPLVADESTLADSLTGLLTQIQSFCAGRQPPANPRSLPEVRRAFALLALRDGA